jgi:hypothetical protein
MQSNLLSRLKIASVVALVAAGCADILGADFGDYSVQPGADASTSGGSAGTGGRIASGGASGSGGAIATGAGAVVASGGDAGSGGVGATGGENPGGTPATGGATTSGGSANTGGVGTGGVTNTGGTTNTGGVPTCGAPSTTPELCNGIDDDQDGLIDEPSTSNTAACNGCTAVQRNGFAYWFCTGTLHDLQPAENDCVSKGGHLASIHDQAEHDFIRTNMASLSSSTRFWIGLDDQTTEGAYVWADGSVFDYHYFTCSPAAITRTSAEDCVDVVLATGCWDDDDCTGHTFPYVCRAPHCP